MIVIRYNKKSEGINLIEERLKEMVLGHKLELMKNAKEVVLIEGKEKIEGFAGIHKYLDEIQGELKQWWYCDC